MKNALLFIYTESSLHAGTGSGLAAVDLPIQREVSTDYPIIQGSGVKGALRSQVINGDRDTVNAIFGPDPEEKRASEHAGALSVGEARIVLFPVRSLMGVFAYVTSPMALARLGRDAQSAKLDVSKLPPISDFADTDCLISQNSSVSAGDSVVLEEFSFAAKKDQKVDNIADWLQDALPKDSYQYWREKLKTSLVILPETAFRDFVKNSTEVTTHIQLDKNTKTVKTGALWTQEALPSDCLLYSSITARQVRTNVKGNLAGSEAKDVMAWLQEKENLPERIQIGGDETTGQGCVALRWWSA